MPRRAGLLFLTPCPPPPIWRIFNPTHRKDVVRWISSTSQPRDSSLWVMRSPEWSWHSITQLPSVRHGLSFLPINSYFDGMRSASWSNFPAGRGRKEIRDGRSVPWEKDRQMKAGRWRLLANQLLPILRKARLGSLPSANDDAESLPTFFAKSISSITGEFGGTEAEGLEEKCLFLIRPTSLFLQKENEYWITVFSQI